MKFKLTCKKEVLWRGRDRKNQYFLFRAMIEEVDQWWELPAYALFSDGAEGAGIREVYSEYGINPGSGIRGNQIVSIQFADMKKIPQAKKVHVEDFEELFGELCQREGKPLLESEILML